jgi:hypothetical protein
MKRSYWCSLFLALAVGCGQSNPPTVANNSAPSGSPAAANHEPLPEGVVLVTLKLPEMT